MKQFVLGIVHGQPDIEKTISFHVLLSWKTITFRHTQSSLCYIITKQSISLISLTTKYYTKNSWYNYYNQWRIQVFPVGGTDLLGGGMPTPEAVTFRILYVKTKESGPPWGVRQVCPPDPPMTILKPQGQERLLICAH